MTELLKQFFSFDKLMKDRLVAAFFLLGLVAVSLFFLNDILSSLKYMGHNFFGGLILFLIAFFKILILFVGLRLACELAIAIFHINNNLSPDGGKSEMAELDPVEAAREIAQKAAKTASSRTKTVVDKTRSRFSDGDEKGEEVYPDYEDPTPPKRTRKKPAAKSTTTKKQTAKKPAAKKSAAKKTTARKTAAKKPVRKSTTKK